MNVKEQILNKDYYCRDTSKVAEDLLGKVLVSIKDGIITSGIIMETEAYYGFNDPASHAFRGITPRSRIMFGKAGISYVYLCYGVHWLLNIVTEEEGIPGAVLIRGLKPFEGYKEMMGRRKIASKDMGLADGPGKMTIAMKIDSSDNGKDVTKEESGLYIREQGPQLKQSFSIKNTRRIGIKNGKDMLLRYIAIGL